MASGSASMAETDDYFATDDEPQNEPHDGPQNKPDYEPLGGPQAAPTTEAPKRIGFLGRLFGKK